MSLIKLFANKWIKIVKTTSSPAYRKRVSAITFG